jgi:hypothetical protein
MQVAEAVAKACHEGKEAVAALSGVIAGNEGTWRKLFMTERAEALLKFLASA